MTPGPRTRGPYFLIHPLYMLTNYLLITITIAAVTLLWRTFKDDHPAFKAWVRSLPLVGEALSCGVCVSFWFTLPVILLTNPLSPWQPTLAESVLWLTPIISFFTTWMSVSFGVLFSRSVVIVLLEAGATLKHRHEATHHH